MTEDKENKTKENVIPIGESKRKRLRELLNKETEARIKEDKIDLKKVKSYKAGKEVVEKTITKKEATASIAKDAPRLKKGNFKKSSDISGRNHTFRVRRLEKIFGKERVDYLKDSCSDEESFKWELYQAELRREITVKEEVKKPKVHNNLLNPDSSQVDALEFTWHGHTYTYNSKSGFNPEILPKLLGHISANGSISSFCSENYIQKHTFYRWLKALQCVKDAVDWGKGRALGTFEKVGYALCTGTPVKDLNKKFSKMPNAKFLAMTLQNRFRDDYHSKAEADNADLKDIANLEGDELAAKAAEIKKRQQSLDSESPFGNVLLYKGK